MQASGYKTQEAAALGGRERVLSWNPFSIRLEPVASPA